jgi:hypothetical protein
VYAVATAENRLVSIAVRATNVRADVLSSNVYSPILANVTPAAAMVPVPIVMELTVVVSVGVKNV